MAFFRQWLLGFLSCALLVSLLRPLCPDGALRQVARFTGGLLLLCALLRPLAKFELPDAAWSAEGYIEAVERLERELGGNAENALADGIARELEAYIEDKADALGLRVQATVTMGCGVPERVTLEGAYSEALSDMIAAELGVAKEKQVWIDSG